MLLSQASSSGQHVASVTVARTTPLAPLQQATKRPGIRRGGRQVSRSLRSIMSATVMCWLGSSSCGVMGANVLRTRSMAFAGPWRAASRAGMMGSRAAVQGQRPRFTTVGRLFSSTLPTSDSLREAIQLKGQQIRDLKVRAFA